MPTPVLLFLKHAIAALRKRSAASGWQGSHELWSSRPLPDPSLDLDLQPDHPIEPSADGCRSCLQDAHT